MNVHIMKVTIKEIAEKTGYSINTVSRALQDKSDVRASTKDLIREAARELGYIPNTLAGSLRSRKTNTIGVISEDSSNPYFAEVILGIEDGARRHGYHMLLINAEEDTKQQQEALEVLLSRQVDGLLIVPAPGSDPQVFTRLAKPFILVGRWLPGLTDHSVMTDDSAASQRVVELLLEKQHKDILFLTGPPSISSSIDRIEGSRRAVKAIGLEIRRELMVETDGHLYGGYMAISKVLQKGTHFTAIVAFNDLVAIGAMRALKEHGIKIPSEVEIIGYDNLNVSQFTIYSLSTVDIPKHKLGVASFEELLKHIRAPEIPYRQVLLESRLVLRETTNEANYPVGV
jgi:LacI family transcriptional regulator